MQIFANFKKGALTIKAPLVVIACLAISIAAAVYISYKMQKKELVETKRAVLKDIIERR